MVDILREKNEGVTEFIKQEEQAKLHIQAFFLQTNWGSPHLGS